MLKEKIGRVFQKNQPNCLDNKNQKDKLNKLANKS